MGLSGRDIQATSKLLSSANCKIKLELLTKLAQFQVSYNSVFYYSIINILKYNTNVAYSLSHLEVYEYVILHWKDDTSNVRMIL